ncbi:MAG TPA: nucleotidyltransferase family protein [Halomonas sp.]|nr:nucleotidyltransferase family protein [Halomonas sp.]
MTPTLRLLILLSRLELTGNQQREALTICEGIDDWHDVARQAQAQFVLPLVYRHLRRLDPPTLSTDVAVRMRDQCLIIVQQSLHMTSEQLRLVRDLVEPLGVPCLFFKGPTLAARYYDDPAMRFCRDIDLLVPKRQCVPLLEEAFNQGYQAREPEALKADRTSLDFAVRTQSVISLVSPRGVEFELHNQLDRSGRLYDIQTLIHASERLAMGGSQMSVMPTSELFVYICLHHTRHCWSHLHWLVDLDAIQRHPDFELTAAYACAKRRGVTATLDACLELYQALAASGPDEAIPLSANGQSLLDACLATLQGGQEVELAMRKSRPTPEFAFNWQTTPSYRLTSQLRQYRNHFLPKYPDYENWPLPPHWQWLYFLIRPFRILMESIGSRSSAK